jgi:hypothetical protein
MGAADTDVRVKVLGLHRTEASTSGHADGPCACRRSETGEERSRRLERFTPGLVVGQLVVSRVDVVMADRLPLRVCTGSEGRGRLAVQVRIGVRDAVAVVAYDAGMAITRISIDHRIMRGVPCIRGTRIPVAMLVRMVANGHPYRDAAR